MDSPLPLAGTTNLTCDPGATRHLHPHRGHGHGHCHHWEGRLGIHACYFRLWDKVCQSCARWQIYTIWLQDFEAGCVLNLMSKRSNLCVALKA